MNTTFLFIFCLVQKSKKNVQSLQEQKWKDIHFNK